MNVWRIEKQKRLASATSGEGARITGGRWNSPGIAALYASEHLSLAVLEILVHAPKPEQRLVARAVSALTIPDALIEVVPPKFIPERFGPLTAYPLTQAIGDEWLKGRRSVALLVPTAIVPRENNLVLNPAHPDFAKCRWGIFEPIDLGSRLWLVP